MEDLSALSDQALQAALEQVQTEVTRRAMRTLPLAAWTFRCFGSSKHHLGKYRHWAKEITSINSAQSDGYAFVGRFLPADREIRLAAGTLTVERCGQRLDVYLMLESGKSASLAYSSTQAMLSLIDTVAQWMELSPAERVQTWCAAHATPLEDDRSSSPLESFS